MLFSCNYVCVYVWGFHNDNNLFKKIKQINGNAKFSFLYKKMNLFSIFQNSFQNWVYKHNRIKLYIYKVTTISI